MEVTLQSTPAIYSMTPQYIPTNFEVPPIGQPLQDGPTSTRGTTHPGAGKHRLGYHPGLLPLRFPNGPLAQNPEEEKKAEVSICYLASGSSF